MKQKGSKRRGKTLAWEKGGGWGETSSSIPSPDPFRMEKQSIRNFITKAKGIQM
jgi:hypothetical protein